MQHDLHNHGDAKVPIELGGKTYMVGGLRLGWVFELEQHVIESNIAASLKAIATQAMTPGDRARIVAEIAARGLSQTDVWNEFMTARGMSFILWKAISETDPSVTLDAIRATRVSQEQLAGLVSIIQIMATRMLPPAQGDSAPDPTTASPSSGTN